jgi:hypothetical protein
MRTSSVLLLAPTVYWQALELDDNELGRLLESFFPYLIVALLVTVSVLVLPEV